MAPCRTYWIFWIKNCISIKCKIFWLFWIHILILGTGHLRFNLRLVNCMMICSCFMMLPLYFFFEKLWFVGSVVGARVIWIWIHKHRISFIILRRFRNLYLISWRKWTGLWNVEGFFGFFAATTRLQLLQFYPTLNKISLFLLYMHVCNCVGVLGNFEAW
jgi:hypothetical protein